MACCCLLPHFYMDSTVCWILSTTPLLSFYKTALPAEHCLTSFTELEGSERVFIWNLSEMSLEEKWKEKRASWFCFSLWKKSLLSFLMKIFKLCILLMYLLGVCHFVDKIFIFCLILSVALNSVDTGKLSLQVKQRMLQSSEYVFLKFCVHCSFGDQ